MIARRVFIIVLDSLGAGEAPDAQSFGDVGSHTLRSLYNTGILNIPNLVRLGIGNIEGLDFLGKNDAPLASVARLEEQSAGKDTTTGHWEISGYVSSTPLPTFPDGFPTQIIDRLTKAWGRGILCNKSYSGTAVIDDYGEEHIKTGKLIVYTSADSVLQIAAHTDIVPIDSLYQYCRQAREIMQGEKYGVGRIIARPFTGEIGSFKRTADRRDFSITPPDGLLAERLMKKGFDTVAVGKISDIFDGKGFSDTVYTHSNKEGMNACSEYQSKDFQGLCFVNLVDFDMLWGHRRDVVGYAEGMNAFDLWLGGFLREMKDDDLLIITADHGCDPIFSKSTDHTREYTPCIVYLPKAQNQNYGTLKGFYWISEIVLKALGE